MSGQRKPQTLNEFGIAVGILLGPEQARKLADLLTDDAFIDGLLFSAAQADAASRRDRR